MSATAASDASERAWLARIEAEPYPHCPLVKLNTETLADINTVWDSILTQERAWRGEEEILHVPGKSIERNAFWGEMAKDQDEPLPGLVPFLDRYQGESKRAFDFGCGGGVHTRLLLERGWQVIAMDRSQEALDVLKAKMRSGDQERLVIEQQDLSYLRFNYPPVDLVVAANVFPYLRPVTLPPTWARIRDYIVQGGHLVGNFFGPLRDYKELSFKVNRAYGAWLFPDLRLVPTLLQRTGYQLTAQPIVCEDSCHISFQAVKL